MSRRSWFWKVVLFCIVGAVPSAVLLSGPPCTYECRKISKQCFFGATPPTAERYPGVMKAEILWKNAPPLAGTPGNVLPITVENWSVCADLCVGCPNATPTGAPMWHDGNPAGTRNWRKTQLHPTECVNPL